MSRNTFIELTSFLHEARVTLNNFEKISGWKYEETNDVEQVVCPNNMQHKVMKNRLEKHLKSCKWRSYGYTRDEVKEILEDESKSLDRRNSVNTDNFIAKLKPNIHPIRTESRYKSQLTPEERLAVYEMVKKEISLKNNLPEKALYVDLEAEVKKMLKKKDSEALSEMEIHQKVRDSKRRRQTYRAKNVHITKRSQTEIVREVLAVHMKELSDTLSIKEGCHSMKAQNRSEDNNRHQRGDSRKTSRHEKVDADVTRHPSSSRSSDHRSEFSDRKKSHKHKHKRTHEHKNWKRKRDKSADREKSSRHRYK